MIRGHSVMHESCDHPFASSGYDDLTILLPVSSTGERSYRSCFVHFESRPMFGAGLMAGQGVWAAAQSIGRHRVRALELSISGEPRSGEGLEYAVESADAKAGNVCRDVYAVQGLDMLGRMQVIFAETEACAAACGTAHAQDASSDAAVAGPAPMDATRRGERRMPFAEIREWIATLPEPGEAGNVRLRVWCRLRHPLPAGGAWRAAALTYIAVSHTPVAVETGRTPAEAASFEPGSGEFSMRFHRGSFDVNDWMLLDSAITRSMTRRYSVETNIFSRSGVLVATSLGKNSR